MSSVWLKALIFVRFPKIKNLSAFIFLQKPSTPCLENYENVASIRPPNDGEDERGRGEMVRAMFLAWPEIWVALAIFHLAKPSRPHQAQPQSQPMSWQLWVPVLFIFWWLYSTDFWLVYRIWVVVYMRHFFCCRRKKIWHPQLSSQKTTFLVTS